MSFWLFCGTSRPLHNYARVKGSWGLYVIIDMVSEPLNSASLRIY